MLDYKKIIAELKEALAKKEIKDSTKPPSAGIMNTPVTLAMLDNMKLGDLDNE